MRLWRRRGERRDGDVEAAHNVAIAIQPVQTYQFAHEDLAELVLALCQSTEIPADRIEARLKYLIGDAPAPGWEGWTIVTFMLDETGRAALSAVIDAAVAWARDWLRERRAERTKGVGLRFIYGPNGEVLKKVKVPRRQGLAAG